MSAVLLYQRPTHMEPHSRAAGVTASKYTRCWDISYKDADHAKHFQSCLKHFYGHLQDDNCDKVDFFQSSSCASFLL